MKKLKVKIVFVCLLIGGSAACVGQKAASVSEVSPNPVETAPLPPAENPASTRTRAEVEIAQKLVEKAPDTAFGYLKLSAAYIRLARESGDFSLNAKAEAAALRALEIEPDNLNAQKLKTSLMLTFHRFAEGRSAAAELQLKNPRDSFFHGALTDANVELGNYAEAINNAQTMVDLKPDMAAYARVSYVRSLHGNSEGAIEAMDLAARIADPLDKEAQAWCLVHLGDEYFKTGSYAQAEQAYDRSLETFPDYHFALAGKGRARAALSDLAGAAKFLTAANNRVPNVENIIFLGDVETRLGNPEEAKKQYDLAEFIEAQFGNLDQRRLALLWADHDLKVDAALSMAQREHAARKDIFTADILAWCLSKKGEFIEAKKIIGEAMRLKTKDARIFYHAGMIENGLGNKQAAADYLKKALQTNPAFDLLQAETARKTLQNLK